MPLVSPSSGGILQNRSTSRPTTIITAPTSDDARPNPSSTTVSSEKRASHSSVGTARAGLTPREVSCSRYSTHASSTNWRESAATSQDPAGPIVVPASDPAPVPTRRISGLLSGTTYHVIVVPEDEARNVNPPAFDPSGTFPAQEVTVTTPADCGPPPTCLWRSDLASVRPHVPDRGAVYLVPPSGDDVHLQGAAYQCPIASGDLEPDANALDNGVPLSLYQVNVAPGAGVLMLSRQGRTIRFTF